MRKRPDIPKGGGGGDGRVSAVPAAVLKSREHPFRQGPVKRFAERPGDPERRDAGRGAIGVKRFAKVRVARPTRHGMRRGGRAGRGGRPAILGDGAGGDAARIRRRAGRRPTA